MEAKCKIKLVGTRKYYPGIDILKFISAFLVLMIHTTPFDDELCVGVLTLNEFFIEYICRIAVPYYFVASGFLLFEKIELKNLDIDSIRNYCFKILRLWGMWLFLLPTVNNYQLWYLPALVAAIILLCILIYNHIKWNTIAMLAFFLYAIGLLGDTYHGYADILKQIDLLDFLITSYELEFHTTRNGIFMGFIFVFIGMMFASKRIVMSIRHAFWGLCGSMLCLYWEVIWVNKNDLADNWNMYICLVPAVYFLFYICMNIKLRESRIYKKLRIIGMLVFYLHLAVVEYVGTVFYMFRDTSFGCFDVQFLIVVFGTVFLAIMLEQLSHKNKFGWIKWLYS